MKKVIFALTTIALVSFTSCEKKEPKQATEAQTEAQASEQAQMYEVDTNESNVTWRGYKIYEGQDATQGHHGTFKLESGTMSSENGKLTAGDFVIDVASLESLDLNDSPEDKAKLDAHLKDEDFLDVEKYPTATFTITDVKIIEGEYNMQISGNFKMRDTEKNISFNANVVEENHKLFLNSEEFTINRQDFGITFKGGKGAVIQDGVTLQVNIVANHKM